MRVLHTSDWHLGVSMEDASCAPEQRLFLRWLIETINARQIDVLLVSGDIFHYRIPSNASRQMFYEFLVDCERSTDLRQVVVVGGNHDSPSGLEAPKELLSYLNVHVTGGLRAEESTWHQLLVPISNDAGEVELVVAAVPYVSEVKLGISGIGKSPEAIHGEFVEAFTHLYSTLADRAAEHFGPARLVATGHLTCYSGQQRREEGDFHSPIHQVGTLNFLTPQIFDPRFEYVALGHIHRMFPVEDQRIYYSGTPVPTARTEVSSRYVVEVSFSGGEKTVEPIKVPRWRDVFVLEGPADEVLERFAELESDCELSPYVFVRIVDETKDYENPPFQRLQSLMQEKEALRPRIIDYREVITSQALFFDEPPPELDALTPEEVFVRMYCRAHQTDEVDPEILSAFRELLNEDPDDEFDELDDKPPKKEDLVEEPA